MLGVLHTFFLHDMAARQKDVWCTYGARYKVVLTFFSFASYLDIPILHENNHLVIYQTNFISNCIIKNEYEGTIYKASKIDPILNPTAPQEPQS